MTDAPFSFARPEWLGEVSSTSDELKRRLAAGEFPPSGFVLAARRQTGGRGRMGNAWLSATDGDLTFSFYRSCGEGPADLGVLPMACALGVRDFLAMAPRSLRPLCKWPNDVLVDDAKICGILAEGGPLASGGFGLVVGIGVNVRAVAGRSEILGRAAVSIEEATGREPAPPAALLPELLACLRERVAMWESGGFPAIRDDLVSCFWGIGRKVTARTPAGRVSGRVIGLGDAGELILRDEAGSETAVSSVAAMERGWEA